MLTARSIWLTLRACIGPIFSYQENGALYKRLFSLEELCLTDAWFFIKLIVLYL